MKILAKFIGKVHEFNEPPALSYVTLKNVDTGEEAESEAVSEKLKEAGVDHTDCEFEVLIHEGEGGKPTGMIIKKLEPREVAQEDVERINKEVNEKLSNPSNFEI
jgi:hypothetical protein